MENGMVPDIQYMVHKHEFPFSVCGNMDLSSMGFLNRKFDN